MKLFLCILYDLFDFTVGRVMFATPFAGELLGCFVGYLMFGPRAFYYALEAIDPTEQIDGFIPTASLIAFAARKDAQKAEEIDREQLMTAMMAAYARRAAQGDPHETITLPVKR
ncbi:MAG: hypothetical protein AAFW01_09165 [Pseudomonadota bacterium]